MLYKENEKSIETLLNSSHLSLLKDKELFLRKRELSDKIGLLFTQCIAPIRLEIDRYTKILPLEIVDSNAKITKGENYLGFPWTILDFPRKFEKKDIFALRTFCWWGNSFSVTLHLSGKYLDKYRSTLFSNWEEMQKTDLMICINMDPWEHHFEKENYRLIKECNPNSTEYKTMTERLNFIKICKIIPLDNWDRLPQITSETTKIFFNLLANKS